MNIEELKNHINIWKPIDKFPLYKDLVIEAKKYYNNNLKYCFSNYNKDIYIINFEYVNRSDVMSGSK